MKVKIDDVIKQATNRFLGWKLPEHFHPDCGISFKQFSDYDHPQFGRHKSEPIGTNLFTADQAKTMFEYCLADALEHGIEAPEGFCIVEIEDCPDCDNDGQFWVRDCVVVQCQWCDQMPHSRFNANKAMLEAKDKQ